MLDPAYVREHMDEVRSGLRNRGLDPDKALEQIATLETARRRIIPELESLKREQNASGDEIARAKRQGKDTTHIQEAGKLRNAQIKQLTVQLDSIEYQRNAALLTLPNLPHASVPVGKSAEENVEVRATGRRAPPVRPTSALGHRTSTRHHRLRAWRQARGCALHRAERRWRSTVSRADQLHARPPHSRAWLPRD